MGDGTFFQPVESAGQAFALAGGGTVAIVSGVYSDVTVIDQPGRLIATAGPVVLGGGHGGLAEAFSGTGGGAGIATMRNDYKESRYLMLDVFPIPTCERLTIRTYLPNRERISVIVFDVLGRRVITVAEASVEAGWNEWSMGTDFVVSGFYFVSVTTSLESITRSFVVIR